MVAPSARRGSAVWKATFLLDKLVSRSSARIRSTSNRVCWGQQIPPPTAKVIATALRDLITDDVLQGYLLDSYRAPERDDLPALVAYAT